MTHFLNLARFTAVASAIAFAVAFNLAAMYAQVVFVFLPGTRVVSDAPMKWASAGSDVTNGIRTHGLDPVSLAIVAVCGLATIYLIVKSNLERRAA